MSEPHMTPATSIDPTSRGRRATVASALFGAFLVGVGVAAATLWHRQPSIIMLSPTPIASMHGQGPVAIRGRVAEIFGNKFVVQDESGSALVETGPKGERAPLVAKAEAVTVQGRFANGFIQAQAISHADGRNEYVGPAGPPPHRGPRGAPVGDAPKPTGPSAGERG